MVFYLRKVCKEKFYGTEAPEVPVLLTQPVDLHFELFVWREYRGLIEHLI